MTKPVFMPAAKATLASVFGGDIYLTMPHNCCHAGLSIFEDVRRPGGGPPLHVHHREDEFFRIANGHFRLRVGEETFEAGPGDTFFLPRDIPHSFVNSGDTVGRIVCICQPGGFEQLFLDVMAENLHEPGDIPKILELAERYEVEFLGPNPFVAS